MQAFPFDRHSVIPYKMAEPEQEGRLENRLMDSWPLAQEEAAANCRFIRNCFRMKTVFFSFEYLRTEDAR